jgi:hypothetical protein
MTSSSHAAVAALLDRYLIGLDSDVLDDAWTASLFTEDAEVGFPPGVRHVGRVGLSGFHRTAMDAFAGTQHLGSPAVVEFDGDRARIRCNLISTHVHHADPQGAEHPVFAAGTFLEGAARLTRDGWRLSVLDFRLVWSTGSPKVA